MEFRNSTDLDDARLYALLLRHTAPYRHDRLRVQVRYSRGADFSGTCYYREGRIIVNIGRHNRYPYTLETNLAKARPTRNGWRRESYRLTVADAEQLALFVYLHELYHYLVKLARRSPRRKEAMCDRFAARVLVDHYGCRVVGRSGRPVPREAWDFADLHAFVSAAPKEPQMRLPLCGAIPVRIRGAPSAPRKRAGKASAVRGHPRGRVAHRFARVRRTGRIGRP